jgi:hypothetical protein
MKMMVVTNRSDKLESEAIHWYLTEEADVK